MKLFCAAALFSVQSLWAQQPTIVEYPIPSGPDGNLWFTERGATFNSTTGFVNKTGKITPNGFHYRIGNLGRAS
jgi:hypothetical protein